MKKRREKGQAMVEFAIVIPLLIIIVCGMIDFGWIYSNVYKVEDAAFTGARYASIHAPEYDATTDSNLKQLTRQKVADSLPKTKTAPIITVDINRDDDKKNIRVHAEAKIKCLTFVAGTIFGDEYTAKSTSVSSIAE